MGLLEKIKNKIKQMAYEDCCLDDKEEIKNGT